MILAIDAGNTRVKWGIWEQGRWAETGAAAHAEIAGLAQAWSGIAQPRAIVVSNVAGSEVGAALAALTSRWRVSPLWVGSERARCGVRNGYDSPAQLGSDRWAALIGARHLHPGACVVVNVGTAMTVDALSAEGVFLGGIIVPGARLMQEALARNTAALDLRPGSFSAFPRNTRDAIASGAIQALCGAVERMASALAPEPASPVCILSGGGAALIETHLRLPLKPVEHLVLDGLLRIALESASL